MSDDVLLVEVRDRVALLTLNRPAARNALSSELLRALPDAMVAADNDDAVDVGCDEARIAHGEDGGRVDQDDDVEGAQVLHNGGEADVQHLDKGLLRDGPGAVAHQHGVLRTGWFSRWKLDLRALAVEL